jgi:hypothetical protein
MEPIANAIDKEKLQAELTSDKFLRTTRRGSMDIYIFTCNDAPSLMLEVARLREVSFRKAGGGTGKSLDLDYHDVSKTPYKQLIVWDPRRHEIVGGYRYALCRNHVEPGAQQPDLSMASYYHFTKEFKRKFLFKSIELGRAWIQPAYQATGKNVNYLYALDNLWDGIGAIISGHPSVEYLYGKVTLFPNYNPQAREILYWFLNHYLSDRDELLFPIRNFIPVKNIDFAALGFSGIDYKYDLKLLSGVLKSSGEVIPPLVNSYLNLTDKIKVFGTVFCPDFGNTMETGILLRIEDINKEKLLRYRMDKKQVGAECLE